MPSQPQNKENMKKLLFSLALVCLSLTATAQDEAPAERHSVSTNAFFSNWFLQADFGSYVNYDKNFAFSLALGKWFTPGIGLRTRVTFSRCNAFEEHVLFNLSNMFCGYSDTRVWNIIPYIGAGWRKHALEDRQAFGYTVGLWNRLRLSRKLALNLDASYGTHELSSKQRALNLEMGLTYSIGKGTWKHTPDLEAVHALYQSEIDALNAQVQDAYAENDELRQQLEQQHQELPPPTDNNMTLPVTP